MRNYDVVRDEIDKLPWREREAIRGSVYRPRSEVPDEYRSLAAEWAEVSHRKVQVVLAAMFGGLLVVGLICAVVFGGSPGVVVITAVLCAAWAAGLIWFDRHR